MVGTLSVFRITYFNCEFNGLTLILSASMHDLISCCLVIHAFFSVCWLFEIEVILFIHKLINIIDFNKMAAAQVLEKEVEDITECPICKDTFCHPKVLPCCHVFCLKCIAQYGEDRSDGDTMPCPMCRQEFTVPTGGFSKLSTNFFIEQIDSCSV